MHLAKKDARMDLSDVSAFIRKVKDRPGFFDADPEIYVARAPGRLDVMGGIADYSGSHVLEMPIAEAAIAGLQKRGDRILEISSLASGGVSRPSSFIIPVSAFQTRNGWITYGDARSIFSNKPGDRWAGYIAGAFLVLAKEKGASFDAGARILIDSSVPGGKGVSSSAALEVATMNAIVAAYKIEISQHEIARLCQKVENLVVGAPCGIMDQISSTFCEPESLLSILCQPSEIRGSIPLPEEIRFWGIDSGIRHSVGRGDYGLVRTGAFMGYRIIADLAGLKTTQTDVDGVVTVNDERWNGYLANLTPAEFEEFGSRLPRTISGLEFLSRFQGITDQVTHVEQDRKYAVFDPTRHPVYENKRVQDFGELLGEPISKESLHELGQLMYESHASYSACGLGSSGTDLLVELVRKRSGLYGAKITGGGSGGTVAVLGAKGSEDEITGVVRDYEKQTGHRSFVFSGSSMGAAAFGTLRLRASGEIIE